MLIQKSELKEIWKSLGKRKLDELKQEVIAILQKQEEKDYKKAMEQFSKEEKKYKYLEKSISGEWIEKAGYGIGTVRVWKGKKYKKIAPGKWARMYEKEDRGTNIAVGKLIAKVKKIDDIEELMNFVMQNKQRFQDENGIDLPILDKIRAEVDRQSGKIESKGKSENTEKEEETKFPEKEIVEKIAKGKKHIDEYYADRKEINPMDDLWSVSDAMRYFGYKLDIKGMKASSNGTKKMFSIYSKKEKEEGKRVNERMRNEFEKYVEKYKKQDETKVAFKGQFATDKQIDYVTEVSDKTILSTEKMLKKPIKTIQGYANSHVEDFKGSVDKFIEYMADRQSAISLDEIAKEWAALVNHNVARKIWESYQGGALEINDDGYFQEKKEEKQQNQMTPKQQKTFDDFEKKAIKKASNADQGKRFAKHNYNIDGEDWTITTDGRVMLCSREKFEEPTKTDKITNMDKVFLINGQKEIAIPDGVDAIIKAAPKAVVTGKDYNGKEKKEFSIIKLGDRYFKTDYLKTVQNFLGPLSNVKMQVIPGDNKSRVKFESGNKAVVLLPIENGAELENRIINTNDIKKSLEDIIMFCNDFEDEDEVIEEINNESLFNDYSAENPELFNSIAFKVEEVLNECGICGL